MQIQIKTWRRGLLLSTVAGAALACLTGTAVAQELSRPAELERTVASALGRAINAGDGQRSMRIERPNARRSMAVIARRAPNKPLAMAGRPRDLVIELTDGVLVQTSDASAVRRLAGLRGVERVTSMRDGSVLLRAASVQEAISLRSRAESVEGVRSAVLDIVPPYATRSLPSDPSFGNQWNLDNAISPLFDANVSAAWDMGYTGAGMTVGVLEGGWQTSHPDLAANYNSTASQSAGFASSHGTAVAGIIGMVEGNGTGGAGAAYGAQLSRLVYGTVSETAEALSYRTDLNWIINNSWGPFDTGEYWTISSQELGAIIDGVTNGRDGLGTIYVWAGGNGQAAPDRVDYDPFASSRYTIAIGSIGDADRRTNYSEPGSSLMAVAHSAGNSRRVWTTTSGSSFTSTFGGTSAAAPLASGVLALVLEANPGMTWRDVQHLVVEHSRKNDPTDASWTLNGAGYEHSYDYGFGAMDAGAMVTAALGWEPVAPLVSFATDTVTVDAALPDNDLAGIERTLSVDQDVRIEWVELVLSAQSGFIGDLEIELIGPSGMPSRFAETRFEDGTQLTNYVFSSVRHWGESSAGTWTVRVADGFAGDASTWQDFSLRFYGTEPVSECIADVTTTGQNPGDSQYGERDGTVDITDLTYVVERWIASDSAVDFTTDDANPGDSGFGVPDGSITVQDLTFYVEAWVEGCPG
ncbi:MAG: S8 family serine peptidase [Planctomycetota bacterium]